MHYTLCDLIADLTQNAVEAQSSFVEVELIETEDNLEVFIRDNGKGMNAELLQRVKDPFYTDGIKHPNRKVGLGIPFLIQTATDTNGSWDIRSQEGEGTSVDMCFDLHNIDTPPIGDVPALFRQMLTFFGDFELKITRKKQTGESNIDYTLSRTELQEVLGGMETVADLALLGEFIQSQEQENN
ncbi:MAG: ATP-binding protein [Spirochaetales bacterium]